MAERSVAEIARETLRLLATRRLAPAPENYQAVYEEVAGILPRVAFPKAPLRRIAALLPSQTVTQKQLSYQFAQAVEQEDWRALQACIIDYAQLELRSSPTAAPALTPAPPEVIAVLPESLAEQLARLIESVAAALGQEDERMRELSAQLAHFLRVNPPPLAALEQMLNNYSYRLSFTSADQAQRSDCIHGLLRMVMEHLLAVTHDDARLQGAAQALSQAMEQPWTLTQLDHIQAQLQNLLFQHLQVQGAQEDMQVQLQSLLAEHAQQLLALGHLSEQHAQELDACATQLQQAHPLGDLAPALQAVVNSGHALAAENRQVQAQLEDLRQQNQEKAQAIEALSRQLQQTLDTTRHDPATGILNAQGMQDTLMAEAARTQHQPQSVAVAWLQLQAADDLQGDASDAAVRHWARWARNSLRPQDALGRMGSMQLAIVLPNSSSNDAALSLGRLQQTLEQYPMGWGDDYYPLHLSAGIVQMRSHETPQETLERAQQSCAQALRMGTHRIALG